MLMSCPFSICQQSWEGPSAHHLCQTQASPWSSHKGQALTLLECILFCLVEDMTPRRAVHALFLNYPRFYNFNSLPFKWAEKLMWCLLILHALHTCNTNQVFWVLFPPRLSFGARFGWYGTQPVQTAISLSLLYLFSFIPRNDWHQNLLDSQMLIRVTRPKIKMGIPLSELPSYPPPQRAHRPCKGSAHPYFH